MKSQIWDPQKTYGDMKTVDLLIIMTLAACTGKVENRRDAADSMVDTTATSSEKVTAPAEAETNSNARFRNVTVEKTGEYRYTVRGEGQLFEATLGWVVEDGHNELKKGFATTDAGAPEWGSFEFTVEVEKERPNSALMLVLFEESAKDGSRQHELPVKLE